MTSRMRMFLGEPEFHLPVKGILRFPLTVSYHGCPLGLA